MKRPPHKNPKKQPSAKGSQQQHEQKIAWDVGLIATLVLGLAYGVPSLISLYDSGHKRLAIGLTVLAGTSSLAILLIFFERHFLETASVRNRMRISFGAVGLLMSAIGAYWVWSLSTTAPSSSASVISSPSPSASVIPPSPSPSGIPSPGPSVVIPPAPKPSPSRPTIIPTPKPSPQPSQTLTPEPPLPTAQISYSVEKISSRNPAYPYGLSITIQTTVLHPEASIYLEFDAPIYDVGPPAFKVSPGFEGGNFSMASRNFHGNVYEFSFASSSPQFGPTHPMTIKVFADRPFNLIKKSVT